MSAESKFNLKHLIPFAIFILIAVLLGVGLTLNPRDLPSTLINKTAPSFELPILKNTQQNFKPSDNLGKKWILNVWASWCAGCRVEHPLLNQLAEKTTIPLVGLNYKDQPDDAKRWLEQRGNPYQQIPMDLAGNAGIDWGVYGVPETFVIDEKGVVIYKHTGPLTLEALENEIMPLFKQQ